MYTRSNNYAHTHGTRKLPIFVSTKHNTTTMKKHSILLLLLGAILSNSAQGQSFVNTSNKWYVAECHYSFTGQTSCETNEFYFGDLITIDTNDYRQLVTNAQWTSFDSGSGYYREWEGKVFKKENLFSNEILIYDFNLQEGDVFDFGFGPSNNLEVITVDSLILNTGERRKRLGLRKNDNPLEPVYWIEGVGSTHSPMDTRYMFISDAWISLNCYYVDSLVLYQLGDCILSSNTTTLSENRLSISPNPASQFIQITGLTGKEQQYECVAPDGRTLRTYSPQADGQISLEGLPIGLFFLKITLENGTISTLPIVKVE